MDEYEDENTITAVETPTIEVVDKSNEPHTIVDDEAQEPVIEGED